MKRYPNGPFDVIIIPDELLGLSYSKLKDIVSKYPNGNELIKETDKIISISKCSRCDKNRAAAKLRWFIAKNKTN
jgi:hypothetical protein